MKTSTFLDQLLKSGQSLLNRQPPSKGRNESSQGLDKLLSGAGGGALAASVMGMMLGNRTARKMGGKAITYGGLAALGMLAYKAYGNWQAQQRQGAAQPSVPMTIDRLPPAQAEEHSHAILRALIAAAKADGHVDERERQLIDAEVSKLTHDPELQRWFDAELRKPLDPAEVAAAATTPEMAAEMYLASVLMVDEERFMERAYLDELARRLGLDDALKLELERQAREAGS